MGRPYRYRGDSDPFQSVRKVTAQVAEAFASSGRYGRERIEEIVAAGRVRRGFAADLVREYLTRHIVHELGPRDHEGMELVPGDDETGVD